MEKNTQEVTPRMFLEMFRQKQNAEAPRGWFGRVLHGRTNDEFRYLSNDPHCRIVTALGPDGLGRLIGLPGKEVLKTVGDTPTDIQKLVNAGYYFRLAYFQDKPSIQLATWEEVAVLASVIYPETINAFDRHLNELRAIPFEIWQKVGRFDWNEVRRLGPDDPRFMTYERFLQSTQTAYNLRRLLFEIGLDETFTGDGYANGVKSYVMPNVRLEVLGQHDMLPVPI